MFVFDLDNGYTTIQHLTDLGCELLQTRIPNWTEGDGSMGVCNS